MVHASVLALVLRWLHPCSCGLVLHPEVAAKQSDVLEQLDGVRHRLLVVELDEGEGFGALGVAVNGDADALHRTSLEGTIIVDWSSYTR